MAGNVTALEGTVENGQIRLPGNVRLPEQTRVYVVIPGLEAMPVAHFASPRLAHPEQAADFVMQITEESADAGL